MPTNELHILLFEDSPTDALLLQESLRQDRLNTFVVTVVARMDDGLHRLAEHTFDALLLDLSLPDSLGLETFEAVRQAAPDMPVVVFSGNTDEEDGIRAVRAGAQDYLVKNVGSFAQVARAVRYAIERNKLEMRLRESERRFSTAFHASPTAQLITLLEDGSILDANEAFCELVGYTRGELIDQTTTGSNLWINAEDRDGVITQLREHGRLRDMEVLYRTRTGAIRTLLISIEPIELDGARCIISTVMDISDRKQAELALRLSEERYRGLIQSLDNVIAIVDERGRMLYMNDVAADLLDGSPSGLTGKTLHELFPESIADRLQESVRRAIREDRQVRAESQVPIRGEMRWHHTSIQPIHDEHGEVLYALVNASDVHGLKSTQRELEELNRTLENRIRQRTAEVQDLYDNAPTGYHSLDADGVILIINQTELKWLGYTQAEVLGRRFTDFVTPASQAVFQKNFPIFLKRGWIRDLEFDLVRKDGSTFPVLVNATAIYDDEGHFLLSRSTVFDNTERKMAEDALRESEGQNRLLFEESPVAITLLDRAGHVIRANRACEEMMKIPSSEMTGKAITALGLITPETAQYLDRALHESLEQGDPFAAVEYQLRAANGTLRDIESRVFVLRIHGVEHLLITSHDITSHKHAEAALRMANMEMERALRIKDEFLANMSHELRTPLGGVLTVSEILQKGTYGPLNELQQKSLRTIESSGQHLLALINDLLDLSKIEAGVFELALERVVADDICQSSLKFVRDLANRKQIRLLYRNHQLQTVVHADPRRLKQMLVNLLSNAVKFTPEGGEVELSVTTAPAAQVIRFAVRDTGIGIAQENLPRLFQPFVQLDAALDREYEGTGLGLALVKRLAAEHGGTVVAESAGISGLGSCFTLTLPYILDAPSLSPVKGRSSPEPPSPGRSLAGLRVLLAEEKHSTVIIVRQLLEHLGCAVTVARTGSEAIEVADRTQFDLLLVDIQLPLVDGLEVVRHLRNDDRLSTTPIIAITALAVPEERERCLRAGADSYLSEPLRLTELIAAIDQLLNADTHQDGAR